jgi:two-component system chemotaxis response regulator CheY
MKHILVVDDSPVVRKIAKRILKDMQFDVAEAEDGSAALRYCNAKMPDAILLDWDMPVMDGFEFLQAFRQMPEGRDSKVVFCTAQNTKSNIMKAISAGADEYIMKPFDEHILREKFEQIGLV